MSPIRYSGVAKLPSYLRRDSCSWKVWLSPPWNCKGLPENADTSTSPTSTTSSASSWCGAERDAPRRPSRRSLTSSDRRKWRRSQVSAAIGGSRMSTSSRPKRHRRCWCSISSTSCAISWRPSTRSDTTRSARRAGPQDAVHLAEEPVESHREPSPAPRLMASVPLAKYTPSAISANR